MPAPERIPLFPLDVVLFPGIPLPLHIFEPRYKLMIRRCLEKHSKFGVILAQEEGIVTVGCTAEIIKVVKRYEDGRMDILTLGQAAYRVLDVFEEEPYLEGAVEYLDDDLEAGPGELPPRLVELYEQCYALVYGRAPAAPDASSGPSVAYQIANELPLELKHKQELLEIRVESERRKRLLEQLSEWLPQLTYMHRMRRKAAGNGHKRR